MTERLNPKNVCIKKRTSLGKPLNHASNNFENPSRCTKYFFNRLLKKKNILKVNIYIFPCFLIIFDKIDRLVCFFIICCRIQLKFCLYYKIWKYNIKEIIELEFFLSNFSKNIIFLPSSSPKSPVAFPFKTILYVGLSNRNLSTFLHNNHSHTK